MGSEMGDMWRDIKKSRQDKKARNRSYAPDRLSDEGIPFESRNGKTHLIVGEAPDIVDFWPGTGKWIPRSTRRARYGINQLVQYIRRNEDQGVQTKPTTGS